MQFLQKCDFGKPRRATFLASGMTNIFFWFLIENFLKNDHFLHHFLKIHK